MGNDYGRAVRTPERMQGPNPLMATSDARVRTVALCVVRRAGKLLVGEMRDNVEGDYFYRPLGGTIEFGERGAAAAAREMSEELGAEVCNVRWLGTIENLFVVHGHPGHEIVLVYEATFVDESMYRRSPIWGQEDDGSPIKAVWKAMDDFRSGAIHLVPDGLLSMLDGVSCVACGRRRAPTEE